MVLGISARKFGRCVKRSKEKCSSQSAMSLSSSSSQQHLPSPNCIYSDTTGALLLFAFLIPPLSHCNCYLLLLTGSADKSPVLNNTLFIWGTSAQCSASLLLWNSKKLKLGWSTHQEYQQYGDLEVENISVRLCYVLAPRHIEHKWLSVTYQHWWSCLSWFSLPEKHQHHLI